MVEKNCKSSCKCCENESQETLLSRVDELINEYRGQKGALIPVLQQGQAIFGYLPEIVQKRISEGLGIPLHKVYGVVTFYSFFSQEPRGKYLIRVCMGTACYVRNGKKVLDELKEQLGVDVGETTDDLLFTLDVGRCFGACGLAPIIMVNDDVYQRLKPSEIGKILESYRKPQVEAEVAK
ncbi:MAG: NAD(P)H-dependent oxidoreductase subunit E [Phycisphaerae bacterium]|nr:NAD(P)H-dependent oxidoreductase subunit E [Phycisphaerae bacterium]